MSADPVRTAQEILRLYGLLHPSLTSDRRVSWEMDLDTFEALLTWCLPVSRAEFVQRLATGELQCFGIRVNVVERPGVRLVVEAVSG